MAAGHDAFEFEKVETNLAGLWGNLGPSREKFLELAHFDRGEGPQFNMTALALRSAGSVNGVSQPALQALGKYLDGLLCRQQ